jgi:hypothetical protein
MYDSTAFVFGLREKKEKRLLRPTESQPEADAPLDQNLNPHGLLV